MASAGVDRRTGRILSDWDHVRQSVEVILMTPVGERVMRRNFGSRIPRMLGENLTEPTVMRFVAAMIAAINLQEPRFQIIRAELGTNSPETVRRGELAIALRGEYRPRGHLGDPTPERQARTLIIGRNGVVTQ